MTEPSNTSSEDVSRVWKLMEDIGICMMASHDGSAIRARPMGARPREGGNVVYFLTSARGDKDNEIEADSAVSLMFAKPNAATFLVVTGRARVLNDRALIRDLWTSGDSTWWSDAEDADIRVIAVTPADAQFWEGPHGVLGTTASVLSAMAGNAPILGDQRKVKLS